MISDLYKKGSQVVLAILFVFINSAVFAKAERYGEVSFENRFFSEEGLF